jgi:hypothetical protein
MYEYTCHGKKELSGQLFPKNNDVLSKQSQIIRNQHAKYNYHVPVTN